MFAYSEREKTHAARHLQDDVPAEVKSRRLQEIIAAFREGQLKQFQAEVGRTHLVGPPLLWLIWHTAGQALCLPVSAC